MATEQLAETKGTDLRALKAFMQEKLDVDDYDRWTASLSDGARPLYDATSRVIVQASKWYGTVETLIEPLEKACELFWPNDPKAGAWEFGRFSADFGFQGVYRLILRAGPAKVMIKQCPKIMSLYLRPSRIETPLVTDERCIMRFYGFPASEAYDHQNCGFVERLIELTGRNADRVELTAATSAGDEYTEVSFEWTEKSK